LSRMIARTLPMLAMAFSVSVAAAVEPGYTDGAFSIEMLPGGHGLRIEGRIDHGMTAELSRLLEVNRGVTWIVLESEGGKVAEARGLVRVIEERGLSTFVEGDCLSVCALAFVSGMDRRLGTNGRLGFHSYSLRSRSPMIFMFMDAEAEQEKDMAIFRRREVDEDFLARIASVPADRMWYPSHQELIMAGIVVSIGLVGPLSPEAVPSAAIRP
jgi:hypothetical protein